VDYFNPTVIVEGQTPTKRLAAHILVDMCEAILRLAVIGATGNPAETEIVISHIAGLVEDYLRQREAQS